MGDTVLWRYCTAIRTVGAKLSTTACLLLTACSAGTMVPQSDPESSRLTGLTLRWLAGTPNGRLSTNNWSIVARAPDGQTIVAHTRIEKVLGDTGDENRVSRATLQRIALDGTVIPLPLHDAEGKPVQVERIDDLAVAPTGMIYANSGKILAITPTGQTRVLVEKGFGNLATDKRGNLWGIPRHSNSSGLTIVTPQGQMRAFRGYPPEASWVRWRQSSQDPRISWYDGTGGGPHLVSDYSNRIWLWVHRSPYSEGDELYRVDDRGDLERVALPVYPPSTLPKKPFTPLRKGDRGPREDWDPKSLAFGPDGTLYVENDARHYNVPAYALWAIRPDARGNISSDSHVDWVAGVVRPGASNFSPWKSPDGRRTDDLPSWPPNEDIARGYAPQDGDMQRWPRDNHIRTYLPSMGSLAMRGRDTLVAGNQSARISSDSADYGSSKILEIAGNNHVRVIADGGPGHMTGESGIGRAVMAPDGSVYYIDGTNLRHVTPEGKDVRVARLEAGNDPDVTALPDNKNVRYPADLLLDQQGNVIIAEPYMGLIRKVTPDGQVSTIAGSVMRWERKPQDGALLEATFGMPQRLTMDSAGDLYVLDRVIRRTIDRGWGGNIRKVDFATGQVTTVARAGDKRAIEDSGGYADIAIGKDDQLLALDEDGAVWAINKKGHHKAIAWAPAFLKRPKELAADHRGNLYIGSIGKRGQGDASLIARIDAHGKAAIVMGPVQDTDKAEGSAPVQFRGLGAMRLTPGGDLLLVLGSSGGSEDGISYDQRVRNAALPMTHNDSASGIAAIEGVADIP